jgi:hypothetical protein
VAQAVSLPNKHEALSSHANVAKNKKKKKNFSYPICRWPSKDYSKFIDTSMEWWPMPVKIPALARLKQKDHKFKAILGCTKSCLKKKKNY